MNWVGGSRNRLMVRNDAKKQREFFERRKMQQKLKNLGLALPAPPPGDSGSGSMDLMTLFIVNQIAAKKESQDPPKVAVLGSSKGGSKHKRNDPLVLPMSPCSPSQLSLVEGEPQCSGQGVRKRKYVIPQGFKCQQLSPVLESAFSDNSASDYLPPIMDPTSPFSSTSSGSSGQGAFHLQLNLQNQSQTQLQTLPHYSPQHWDTSILQQTKFQPFSQRRGMTDTIPWSCGSNPPLFQLETPTAAQVLFGSPGPDGTQAGDHARQAATFSLSQPEDKEAMLDFTLKPSGTNQQFEEDVFSGFSNDEYGGGVSHFGRAKSKIYLTDETSVQSSTPHLRAGPDSQRMGAELSDCADVNFSSLGHNAGPMNGCEYSPSYCCGGGYLSSDSSDDEECCQPCLQTSSYMDQADALNTHNGSQGNPKQSLPQPRPPTPLIKSKRNYRDDRQTGQQTGSSTALFLSPRPPTQSQNSELCKCKKTSVETQDAGTQTVYSPTAGTCDASTQCSFVAGSETRAPGFHLYLPNVEQRPATGRQTDTAAEPAALAGSSEISQSEGRQTPWSKKKAKAGSLSGSSIVNKYSARGKVILQRPTNPFLDALSKTEGRGKVPGEGRDERQEHDPLMKDLSDGGREEVPSTVRLSEEAETLQEIADILLLLQQRKKEG